MESNPYGPGVYDPPKEIYNPRAGMRVQNSSNPSQALTDVSMAEDAHYQETYRPLNESMVADVNSTKLVDVAKQKAAPAFEAGLARSKRQSLRFGATPTGLDSAVQRENTDIARTTSYDNSVNGARFDQYERNTGLRNELINTSRGIAGQSVDGLTTAASLQTSRTNANDQAKAQNSAAKTQAVGSMIATALMVLI